MSYSARDNGAYCKICVLFATSGAGVNSQELGTLVKKPFSNWKKAIETFNRHAALKYHMDCVISAENFIRVFNNPVLSVDNQIDQMRLQQIQENRKRILPIIETVLFCGRQELALRGHRDYGNIPLEEPLHNDGNFRSALRYRAKGDIQLKETLEGPGYKYLR